MTANPGAADLGAKRCACQGDGMWTVEHSRELAAAHLSALGNRWLHVQAAGRRAEELRDRGLVDDGMVSAAWLHDIGYAPALVRTGFHPVDGAVFLQKLGAPKRIVALVASHTGAYQEAAERGLLKEWSELPEPGAGDLDVLTLVDLVTSPTGQPVQPDDRIREILSRYGPAHEVHRAVSRSGPGLLEAATRAKTKLELPDEWPGVAG